MRGSGNSSLSWLQGRELGRQTEVGQQDRLYRMLYGSVDIIHSWSPLNAPSEQQHGGIFNFDFSTDGAALVAACEGKSFLVFDPNNQKLITSRRRAHADCVNCVRFLDTRSFVTCSDDTTVALWDLRCLRSHVRVFEGHSNWVKNVEYASSLGLLITSGFDGAVYSWNINNYSKEEECKRLFSTEGLMRCKLTPDESKLVLSTSQGYLLVIHDLDLPHLNVNMDHFKADSYGGPRLHALITNFNSLFTRQKNRLEIVNEFPSNNDAENIASLQVHPQGWCVVSRNTSKNDLTEWTCVHDIHTQPALRKENEEGKAVPQFHLNFCQAPRDSSARTNPPHPVQSRRATLRRRWPMFHPHHTTRYHRVSVNVRDVLRASSPGASAALSRQGDDDSSDSDSDSSNSDTPASDQAGSGNNAFATSDSASGSNNTFATSDGASGSNNTFASSDSASGSNNVFASSDSASSSSNNAYAYCSPTNVLADSNLYRYFVWAQWNHLGHVFQRNDIMERLGNEAELPERSINVELLPEQSYMAMNRAARRRRSRARSQYWNRHVTTGGLEHFLRSYYLYGNMPKHNYHSQPRLIYSHQEPNVGRGYIKEQCFSSDGRLIVSPYGNGVRLLAFDDQCRELCDCGSPVAGNPHELKEVRALRLHPNVVLTTRFSPTHMLCVSGSLDGSVSFMAPTP